MHSCTFVRIAKIVLINDACEPVRTPSVLGNHGRPIPFILLGEQSLKFGSQAFPLPRFDLGFEDVNIGVDHALERGRHRGGQCVEFNVVVRVFPLEFFGLLPAHLDIEIANKLIRSEAPRVPFVPIDQALNTGEVGRVKVICSSEVGADFRAVLASEFGSLRNAVKDFGTGAGLPRNDRRIRVQRGSQVVSVLLGDGRDVVDGQVKQQHIAVRSEAHVVDGFRAQTHP